MAGRRLHWTLLGSQTRQPPPEAPRGVGSGSLRSAQRVGVRGRGCSCLGTTEPRLGSPASRGSERRDGARRHRTDGQTATDTSGATVRGPARWVLRGPRASWQLRPARLGPWSPGNSWILAQEGPHCPPSRAPLTLTVSLALLRSRPNLSPDPASALGPGPSSCYLPPPHPVRPIPASDSGNVLISRLLRRVGPWAPGGPWLTPLHPKFN